MGLHLSSDGTFLTDRVDDLMSSAEDMVTTVVDRSANVAASLLDRPRPGVRGR